MCFAGSSNLWCLGRVSMHVLDICGRLPRQEVLNLVNCLQILNHFWPQRQNFAIVWGKNICWVLTENWQQVWQLRKLSHPGWLI